ncbi:hypothetical protein CKO35_04005 [Ectothiorhodospira shaposhnikovii]|uniref:SPASM domain-containing protein n=1 Tax=Ectothiorhodospira shaposhnikovii TaxID=1054 RepID=UPI0019040C11|nr:SPASM domain-containing protein [Ectothiorhodospira shaposhnikovii]MBK1672472.1 hypothetical protein [Ectothiorhodospira shaposhnikovii]
MPVNSIYTFHFDIVHGCQLRCLGCPNATLAPKVERISEADFRRCLGNVDVRRIHTLRLFNFGEPLLHKELSLLVAAIPEQKWKVSIVELSTNAQHVYWDDFEAMMKLEVVNRIAVSCDGDGTPEEYERLRPPSRWERLLEFLERTRALRDRWSPATQLITRTIIRTREDRQRWERVLLPRGWTPEFRHWMNLPQSSQNLTGRPPQIPEGVCFFLAEPEAFSSHPWGGEIRFLHVDHDGTVVPCCAHPRAGVLGNLKHEPYSRIVTGKARGELVALMARDRKRMPVCGQCEMGPVGQEGPSFSSGQGN